MKKIWLFIVLLSLSGIVFAYNPPVGGQFFYNLADPLQLSSASSAAGGGIFTVNSNSIISNPALPAYENRAEIDLSGSALINAGSAFQMGTIIPTRMFVISGFMNGTFCDVKEMDLGNSFNIKAGLSKQVTERISVGANIYTGILKCDDVDWSLGMDIGALYRMSQLGFMKDFRIGASVNGFVKNYSGTDYGVKYEEEPDWYKYAVHDYSVATGNSWIFRKYIYDRYFAPKETTDTFPGFHSLRTGAAANFFKTSTITGGLSADVTVAGFFQDMIFDYGFQLSIKDNLLIRVGQTFDILELNNEKSSVFPVIGVSYKMKLNMGKSNFIKNHGWETSELRVAAAQKYFYDNISAYSAGANLILGLNESDGPSIQVFEE